MNSGETLTFFQLITKIIKVEIPIIQRDFAQGRPKVHEVRKQFLESIYSVLHTPENKLVQPLDLDFVYGSFDSKKDGFSLLDGQQRLTTLFLLHWYLSIKDGVQKDFKGLILNECEQSKFTYQTRPSSTEFFDALASQSFSLPERGKEKLSTKIIDSRWFFLSWKLDPTIKSCLTMLDSIHAIFNNSNGFYSRLINTSQPYVTFQFLNMDEFGLSDELYIKMNARGKELTSFENFKAWLFGYIDKHENNDLSKMFQLKIDQEWTDIFWNFRDKEVNTIDSKYLRFFNVIALFNKIENVVVAKIELQDRLRINNLRSAYGHSPVSKFEEEDTFNNVTLNRVESFLEFYRQFASENEENLFKGALGSNDYTSLVKFYSLVIFISQINDVNEWDSHDAEQLRQWTRITNNLIENVRIDDLTSFMRAIHSLKSLSKVCSNVYEEFHSISRASVDFFSPSQVIEEKEKVKLILADRSWESLLIEFENHWYFNGQIKFLLDLSGDDFDRGLFTSYGQKAANLFSRQLVNSKEFLIQRALLTLDNYLIKKGRNNSFCMPSAASYRDRVNNWRAVFKKSVFKTLLDAIGNDAEKSLKKLIKKSRVKDWRQYFINYPKAIAYCKKMQVRFDGNKVYLLKGERIYGEYAELRTYTAYLELKYNNSIDTEFSIPETINYYFAIGEDDTPIFYFKNELGAELQVEFNVKNYEFEMAWFDEKNAEELNQEDFIDKLDSNLAEHVELESV